MNGHFFVGLYSTLVRQSFSLLRKKLCSDARNLDLTKCQGTGEMCSLYRKPRFNEFLGKQLKYSLNRGSLYRGSLNRGSTVFNIHRACEIKQQV